MSFTYIVLAEYRGAHILHEPQGPNIGGGSNPLGPMKSAPMKQCDYRTGEG